MGDEFTQGEIDEAIVQLMENDGSIDSGWKYRELLEHHRTFEGIIRALLNREFHEDADNGEAAGKSND